jgi:hypothetical protein
MPNLARKKRKQPAVIDNYLLVRFQVLTAASMMFRVVFWVILPCNHFTRKKTRNTCKMITREYNPDDNSEQLPALFRITEDTMFFGPQLI